MPIVCKNYIRFMNIVNKIIGWVLALMLGVMSILIFWQVFARFVVGNSLTFSEEISRFLMVWLTLLGSAYALRQRSLIAVDVLPELLKGRAKVIIMLVSSLLSLIFYFVLILFGWEISQSVAFQRAPATNVSMFWPMFALCVGGVFLFLNTLVVLIEELYKKEG